MAAWGRSLGGIGGPLVGPGTKIKVLDFGKSLTSRHDLGKLIDMDHDKKNRIQNRRHWRAVLPAEPLPFVERTVFGVQTWAPGEVWVARGRRNDNRVVFRTIAPKEDSPQLWDVEVLAADGPWLKREHGTPTRFQTIHINSYFGQHSTRIRAASTALKSNFQKFQLVIAPTKRDVARSIALLSQEDSAFKRSECCPIALATQRALRARFRRWKDPRVSVGITSARCGAGDEDQFRVDLPSQIREFVNVFDYDSRRPDPIHTPPPAPTILTFTRVES